MSILPSDKVRPTGLLALSAGSNGIIANGPWVSNIASFLNMLASRRMHVLAQHGGMIGSYNTDIDIAGAFHTSPNCKQVRALIIAGRSNSATVTGAVQFSVNGDLNDILYFGGVSGGATNSPSELVVAHAELVTSGGSLVGNTDYTFGLQDASGGFTRTLYLIIYEVPRGSLDTASDTAIPLDVFGVNAPILDRDVRDIIDAEYTIYKRQGPGLFSFAAWPTIPTQTGGTWKNILDGSTAGYSASAAGYWTIPYRKGTMTGSTLSVVLWYGGNVAAGSDGEVRWVNADGVIGSITGITTSGAMRTTTATISTASAGSQLVIVEHRSTGSTISTESAGMYEYLA